MKYRLILLASLPLVGCNFAPAYHRPSSPVPAAYQDASPDHGEAGNADWQLARPDEAAPRGKWWLVFNDPALAKLEDKVASANQNIAAAVARYDEARATLKDVRAAEFPTLGADAFYDRSRYSQTTANVEPNSMFNTAELDFNFNYELDLWGRVRNLIAEAKANAAASAADLATMNLDAHASLANDYFALRGEDSAVAILGQTADADRKALDLVQTRYNLGTATQADLAAARTTLDNVQTQYADARLQRAALQHAIAILVGASAADFSLPPSPLADNVTVPAVNPGVPAQLLERRPDVAAAERTVMAANAAIGVARAAFFPTISLSAMFGGESKLPGAILEAPSQTWSLGPQASIPLFEGGALEAASETARAQRDEDIANYRSVVLAAMQDVEDNLTAQQLLAQEAVTANRAVVDGKQSLGQETALYKGGDATWLDVVQPQTTYLQAQLNASQIAARRLETCVALIKALGGGWQASDKPAI